MILDYPLLDLIRFGLSVVVFACLSLYFVGWRPDLQNGMASNVGISPATLAIPHT